VIEDGGVRIEDGSLGGVFAGPRAERKAEEVCR